MLSIFAIGSGLTYYLGRMTKNQAPRLGCVGRDDGPLRRWRARSALHFEAAGNPIHQQLGIAAADGNMEGKEVRFGIFNSSLFADDHDRRFLRCGELDARLLHRHRWLVPLFMIELGEVVIGGVGAGLYGMLGLRRARRLHRRSHGRAARRSISARRSRPTT